MAKEPSNALALSDGWIVCVDGRYREAKEDLDTALDIDPRMLRYGMRGVIICTHHRVIFKRPLMITIARSNWIRTTVCVQQPRLAYYKLGDRDKGLKNINMAAKKSRSNPFVFRNLGLIALESGDTARACGHFRTALSLQFTAFHGSEVQDLVNANCNKDRPVPPVAAPSNPDNGSLPSLPTAQDQRTNPEQRTITHHMEGKQGRCAKAL